MPYTREQPEDGMRAEGRASGRDLFLQIVVMGGGRTVVARVWSVAAVRAVSGWRDGGATAPWSLGGASSQVLAEPRWRRFGSEYLQLDLS